MKKFLLVAALIAVIFSGCMTRTNDFNFRELEDKYNARIGVYVLDTNDNREISYNADERFAYCSTHKFLSAALILQRKSRDELNERKFFSAAEIVPYSPITQAHVVDGMTLAEICEAALRVSDNTAANLMLAELGGVDAFKMNLRELGDDVTEPARLEPELNIFAPDNIADTSTPRQLAKDLELFLLGDALSDDKKILLTEWLGNNTITDKLIKSGVPDGWQVLDKSGGGINYGTRNDVALVCPPNKKPIVVAIMTRRNEASANFDSALVADVAQKIFSAPR